jgi:excisionase family DNA binding protein
MRTAMRKDNPVKQADFHPDDRVFARPSEAARSRGIGEASVYRLLAEGKIEGRKFGRTTLIILNSLDKYLLSLPAPIYSQRPGGGKGARVIYGSCEPARTA